MMVQPKRPAPLPARVEILAKFAECFGVKSAEAKLRAMREKSLERQLRNEARMWDFVRGNTRSPA